MEAIASDAKLEGTLNKKDEIITLIGRGGLLKEGLSECRHSVYTCGSGSGPENNDGTESVNASRSPPALVFLFFCIHVLRACAHKRRRTEQRRQEKPRQQQRLRRVFSNTSMWLLWARFSTICWPLRCLFAALGGQLGVILVPWGPFGVTLGVVAEKHKNRKSMPEHKKHMTKQRKPLPKQEENITKTKKYRNKKICQNKNIYART